MSWLVICLSPHPLTTKFQEEIKTLFLQHQLLVNWSRDQFKLKGQFLLTEGIEELNLKLQALGEIHRVDMGLIPESTFLTEKKLIVFDMDSTLITAEVIDEMAARHGVGEQVRLITQRAMNGELDFNQSFIQRVSLLQGLARSQLERIAQELTLTPGTEDFLKLLKKAGIKTAIASGGLEYFARLVASRLEIDEIFANNLEFRGEHLSGRIVGEIVNGERKAQVLEELAIKYHLSLNQVVAIGDGANDIPMLQRAGTGIAIHGKAKVQRLARCRINYSSMMGAASYLNLDSSL
jgi:phosphoserine phosphatase